MLPATGIVCQVLPESKERCRAPPAESVQRGKLLTARNRPAWAVGPPCAVGTREPVRLPISQRRRAPSAACSLNFFLGFVRTRLVLRLPLCGLRRHLPGRGCALDCHRLGAGPGRIIQRVIPRSDLTLHPCCLGGGRRRGGRRRHSPNGHITRSDRSQPVVAQLLNFLVLLLCQRGCARPPQPSFRHRCSSLVA